MACRYVRTGTYVPQIYPGTLSGITSALRDCERFSTVTPGKHRLDAVFGKERVAFRIYEAGECTWQEEPV